MIRSPFASRVSALLLLGCAVSVTISCGDEALLENGGGGGGGGAPGPTTGACDERSANCEDDEIDYGDLDPFGHAGPTR